MEYAWRAAGNSERVLIRGVDGSSEISCIVFSHAEMFHTLIGRQQCLGPLQPHAHYLLRITFR